MMLKMYTSNSGIALLKEGYSAYAYDEKHVKSDVPFLVSKHSVEELHNIFVGKDLVVYLVKGKISVVEE